MSSFFRLRPTLHSATNIFRQHTVSSHRTFHASPRPQFTDPTAIVSGIHEVFNHIHSSTGLPWGATIPLAALLMRVSFILPISIYSHRKLQKTAELQPIIQAWGHQAHKMVMKNNPHGTPGFVQKQATRILRSKRKELIRRAGVQRWKIFAAYIAQLPVWITCMGTVRTMCGSQTGLLSMFALPDTAKIAVAESWAEAGSENARNMTLVEGVNGMNVLTPATNLISMEPGFATEGLLWFPNLLMPDPYLWPLPVLVSCAMVLNAARPMDTHIVYQNMQQGAKRRYRGYIVLGVLVAPFITNFPAAVLLFWASSSSLAFLQTVLLNRFMPIKPLIEPCKPRAVRYL